MKLLNSKEESNRVGESIVANAEKVDFLFCLLIYSRLISLSREMKQK